MPVAYWTSVIHLTWGYCLIMEFLGLLYGFKFLLKRSRHGRELMGGGGENADIQKIEIGLGVGRGILRYHQLPTAPANCACQPQIIQDITSCILRLLTADNAG
jgi:hypothetical protein